MVQTLRVSVPRSTTKRGKLSLETRVVFARIDWYFWWEFLRVCRILRCCSRFTLPPYDCAFCSSSSNTFVLSCSAPMTASMLHFSLGIMPYPSSYLRAPINAIPMSTIIQRYSTKRVDSSVQCEATDLCQSLHQPECVVEDVVAAISRHELKDLRKVKRSLFLVDLLQSVVSRWSCPSHIGEVPYQKCACDHDQNTTMLA